MPEEVAAAPVSAPVESSEANSTSTADPGTQTEVKQIQPLPQSPSTTTETDDSSHSEPPAKDSNPFDEFKDNKTSEPVETNTSAEDDNTVDPEPADWKDIFPEALKTDSFVNRFESAEEFAKGLQNMKRLVGKKGLERPDPNAPPEHWNEYWDTIGRPSSPDAYEIQNIKDSTGTDIYEFDSEVIKEVLPEVHKLGYTNDQAQFMFDLYAKREMASMEAEKAAFEKRTLNTLTELQAEFKESTDATIKRGLNALENLGIYDALAEAGLDTDIRFVKAGIRLSHEYSEATIGEGASVKNSMSRLEEIEALPAFRDARDPNHKKLVNERNRILKEMHA